jgi:parallel beta-helix repeat protein
VGIIVLFLGAGIIPSTVGTIEKRTVCTNLTSGSYIQGLIDNASAGDTIYVPSGIYYENIIINKPINLVGEDKNSTIIDGGGSGNVVYISAQGVSVSGFTIRNGDDGIKLYKSRRISIRGNIISNNGKGIDLVISHFNTVKGNNISNNVYGVYLSNSRFNFIQKNNFILNEQDAFFSNFITGILDLHFLNLFFGRTNRWMQNYWNKPRLLPKLIFGVTILYMGGWYGPPDIYIPWIPQIDWRPAQEPYDIGGV